MAVKRYAVNSQSFEEIRRCDFYYVDKTDMVYELAQKYKSVFLSRPRRFGKTLLTQTFDAYFSGNQELFEGLKIAELEQDWKPYPVLHFDLSGMKLGTSEQVSNKLDKMLLDKEKAYHIENTFSDFGDRLEQLITECQRQMNAPAVVIIDEYDAPILDAYGMPDLPEIRKILMTFFSPLKKVEKDLRFVFLTGVTKFSTLSIFSSLNTLTDISTSPHYNALCGFTDQEIDDTLSEGIVRIAQENGMSTIEMRQQIKNRYNGYRFSRKDQGIYNPFSVVNALSSGELKNYWFGSGTPTFVTKALRDAGLTPESLQDQELDMSAFDTPIQPVNGEINATALLYQSGYFTIKGYDPELEIYMVGIPNQEVR